MEKKFITESKKIDQIDFLNLRNLYIPILGLEPISLYQLLFDFHLMNNKNLHYGTFKYLENVLQINKKTLEDSLKKLEAVGLLRTFEKTDNKTFLFVINKPLTPLQFKSNSFLYRELLKVISEQDFERIFFYQKETILDKTDFQEKTVKFYDLFDIKNHQKEEDFHEVNTLEIPLSVEFSSVLEAIDNLSSYRFVKYLTKKSISPSLLTTINQIHNLGFTNASINFMCYYSFKTNDKIVANYIKTIANDLLAKNICSFKDVKLELEAALDAKININQKHEEKANISENDNKNTNIEDILDWDELTSSLGNF